MGGKEGGREGGKWLRCGSTCKRRRRGNGSRWEMEVPVETGGVQREGEEGGSKKESEGWCRWREGYLCTMLLYTCTYMYLSAL